MENKLKSLYDELQKLTWYQCAKFCKTLDKIKKVSCCSQEYCGIAKDYALMQGIDIPYVNDTGLPYQTEKGCAVPAHLRPMCSRHICDHILFRDAVFYEKYSELVDQINEIEFETYK